LLPLADEFALLTSTGASPAPPHPSSAVEVDVQQESRAAVQKELLQQLMEEMVTHSRAEVRGVRGEDTGHFCACAVAASPFKKLRPTIALSVPFDPS